MFAPETSPGTSSTSPGHAQLGQDADQPVRSFGYLDGISNPAIIGFDKNPPPGPAPVSAGVILLGQEGDENKEGREPWMADGSFLVFRELSQNVPEFDEFVDANRLQLKGLSPKEGADLFGARLVGRWKSGMHPSHPTNLEADIVSQEHPLT